MNLLTLSTQNNVLVVVNFSTFKITDIFEDILKSLITCQIAYTYDPTYNTRIYEYLNVYIELIIKPGGFTF